MSWVALLAGKLKVENVGFQFLFLRQRTSASGHR